MATCIWGMIGYCPDQLCTVNVGTLESVDIQVSIRGFAAKVNASLTYHNATDKAIEVEYRIPIDEGAAVYKFEAVVNGRKITAHCMEKKKAETVYKEAVDYGRIAFLAREDKLASDVLHLALGNLPAGTKAELKLTMVMELRVKTDGAVSFTLPSVLNPRYCPADVTADKHTQSVAQHGSLEAIVVSVAYTFGIKAKVKGGHAIARIVSHSDPLNVNISDDAMSAEITQDGGFKHDHDWSMLLYYSNPYKTHIIRETGDRSSTGLMKDDVVIVSLHPELAEQSYSNKNEILFVVDRSASMDGDKMQSARATLLLFIKSLPAGCYFNIISFGNSHSLLFPNGSEMYTEETLQKACELQENMAADMGGTEIFQPLQHIYSKPPKPGFARQIILLSDGDVFNVGQVMQLVQRNAHDTRVFAVGIGHGASTALINGVARAGKGRAEMAYQQDKLQLKVMGLVRSMLQECVQEVEVNVEVDPPGGIKLVPKIPPVIFGGQHLLFYIRLPPTTIVKQITVRGVMGKENFKATAEGSDIVTIHDEEMTCHRLAARAQIKQWQTDEQEDVGEDTIALSLASGVVSRLTALVGVDQDMKPLVVPAAAKPKRHMEYDADDYYDDDDDDEDDDDDGGSYCYCSQSLGPASASPVLGQQRSQSFAPTVEKAVKSTEGPPAVDGLMAVVNLQKFDGSWTLEDAAKLTSLPRPHLNKTNTAKNEKSWATAIVLAFLEMKYSSERDQWVLLANKARMFISNCGDDVESLISSAKKIISEN